jgi:hypothetical protein
MSDANNLRIAWIYPSIRRGAYWQPIINEFITVFANTRFCTGYLWSPFNENSLGADIFKTVGKASFVKTTDITGGYSRGYIYASPKIVFPLLKSRPHVILASAFSVWTLLALFLKPIGWWKVIIIYDGSSPNTDFKNSKLRLLSRILMARMADAFISNSQAAVGYLHQDLGIPKSNIHYISLIL